MLCSVVLSFGLMTSSYSVRIIKGSYKTAGTFLGTDIAAEKIQIFEDIRDLQPNKSDFKIVEAGAGSGEITLEFIEYICEKEYKNISIDAIEYDEENFDDLQKGCDKLKEKYGDCYPDVKIYCDDFTTWKPRFKNYDYVISTIPHNKCSVAEVRGFVKAYERLVAKDGIISYVAYMALGGLKKLWNQMKAGAVRVPYDWTEFAKIEKILQRFRSGYHIKQINKYRHYPPIYIYVMKRKNIKEKIADQEEEVVEKAVNQIVEQEPAQEEIVAQEILDAATFEVAETKSSVSDVSEGGVEAVH